ncbi:DUF190 domain-containing protein [Deltaproteobacteria bacterium TL4]
MMSDKYTGKRLLARITIKNSSQYEGKSLYLALIEKLEAHHIFGATVTRGVGGFGSHAHFHTDRILSLSSELPLIIEFVDYEERIRAILPEIDPMIPSGMITLEQVEVVFYRQDFE